jgi:hypothetical protein
MTIDHPHTAAYTALQAYCDLATREMRCGLPLPANLCPLPHLQIVDVERFVSTNLMRLEAQGRGVAAESAENLGMLIMILESRPCSPQGL